MLNLLTAERIKLIKSKKLWIVFSILALLPIYQVIMTKINVHYGAELSQPIETVINGATGILMIDKNGLSILLVMSAFISFFIGEEFQHGTIRNALSIGRSRIHYYLSKLTIATLVSFIGIIILTSLGIIGYTVAFGFGEVAGVSNYISFAIQSLSTQFILIIANVSIYVMISFIAKNIGISLIWSFLYTIVTGFVPGIFQQTEHFNQVTFWFTETFLFYFDFIKNTDAYPQMIYASLITIVISTIIGILMFKRTDIK